MLGTLYGIYSTDFCFDPPTHKLTIVIKAFYDNRDTEKNLNHCIKIAGYLVKRDLIFTNI